MASSVKPIEDRRTFAIGLMVVAFLCYTIIDSCAKLMVQAGLPPMEVVFVRYAGQFILVLAFFVPREGRALVRTRNLKLEVGRGLFLLALRAWAACALLVVDPAVPAIAAHFASDELLEGDSGS